MTHVGFEASAGVWMLALAGGSAESADETLAEARARGLSRRSKIELSAWLQVVKRNR